MDPIDFYEEYDYYDPVILTANQLLSWSVHIATKIIQDYKVLGS